MENRDIGNRIFSLGSRRRRARQSAPIAMVIAAVSVFGMSACGGGQNSSSSDTTPQQGGTLRVVESIDPLNCVDPFQTAWTGTRSVVRNYAESLIDQDPDSGEFKPWLAESWTISDDGKTYTFKLRDGITFSDGEQLNADAVVKTIESDLQTLKENPGIVGGFYVLNLESATKVDDSTVQFNLSAPNSSFLQGLATPTLAILSPKSVDHTAEERCSGEVVGTGPFVLEKYDPSNQTVLTKRGDHKSPSPFADHTGDAYLDKIVISYVAENSVRIGNLVSGNADALWTDPLVENDIDQIKASGGNVLTRSLPGSIWGWYPNLRDEGRPLADQRVRKAVSLGIDRETYASTVLREDYPIVTGVLGSNTPTFRKVTNAVEYDPNEAASLLDEAGWEIGDDGYRYKDGKKLTIEFLSSSESDGAELVQDELKKIGVDLQINVVTSAQYTSLTNAGKYDFVLLTYARADPSALNVLLDTRYATFKAITGNAQNDEQQAYLEDAFDRATATTSEDTRADIYGDIQQYIGNQTIAVPLFERVQDIGVSSKVHGIRFTAECFSDFYDTWLSE